MNHIFGPRLLAMAETARIDRAKLTPEELRVTDFAFLETWCRHHLAGMLSCFEACFRDPFPVRSQDTGSWVRSVIEWATDNTCEYLADHLAMLAMISRDQMLFCYNEDGQRPHSLFTDPKTFGAVLNHLESLAEKDPSLQITEEHRKIATILVITLEISRMSPSAAMIAILFQVQVSEFEYILVNLALFSRWRTLFDLFCSTIPKTISLSLDIEWCLRRVEDLIQMDDFDRINWIIDRVDFSPEQLEEIAAMIRAKADASAIRETIIRSAHDHDPDGPRDLTPNAA